MFVVDGGMHAVVDGPEEEAAGLKLATRVVSSARSTGTCTIAGENEGAKPHGLSRIYFFGFMYMLVQLAFAFT